MSGPTFLRGDPHERGVTGSARRARPEEAARHSQAQRSSMLDQVCTRFDLQTSLCSDTLGSGDDETDYDESVGEEESIGEPVDWNPIRGAVGQFKRRVHSSAGPSDQARGSQVEDVAPRRRRRSQSSNADWLITSPQPGGPIDTRLIPSIARVIYEGSERTPRVLECRLRKKTMDAIIKLQDMSDELYPVLHASSLGRLPYIMHQHIDSALISAFVERWQPDTNTFHMSWGKMTIMLHDVQRILGLGINGALPAEGEWKMTLISLFGEPVAELRRKGYFKEGSINVSDMLQLCHRFQALDTQTTAYYMSIVGSTLLVDKTRIGMRPHSILAVNADQDEIAWGTVTLGYLYRQLGMASRVGCRTIAGCLTLSDIDQELRRAEIPSETVPEYIDWYRSCTHACITPGDGPSRAFASAANKLGYFAAEYSARVAPLIRIGPVEQWQPQDRQAAEVYLEELRELFGE